MYCEDIELVYFVKFCYEYCWFDYVVDFLVGDVIGFVEVGNDDVVCCQFGMVVQVGVLFVIEYDVFVNFVGQNYDIGVVYYFCQFFQVDCSQQVVCWVIW